MKLISLLCVVFIYFGCQPAVNRQKVVLDKDTEITLQRTTCFGTCPAYKVTIDATGGVVFNGSKMIRENGNITPQPLGTKNSRISQEQLQELIAEFDRIDYLSLKDAYKEGSDCPTYSTDSPSAITTIKTNGTTKSVNHYAGCEGSAALKDLTALERKIDEIVNTKQWLN
jgi:hypothetical protein